MKKGLIKKIEHDYLTLVPPDWTKVKSSYYRRRGSWLQIIAFNPSRFDDVYEPRSCLEYLKRPGLVVGAFLPNGLRHKKHNVQRWITLKEHETALPSVYADMVEQFRPAINQLLDIEEIKLLLRSQPNYWPHIYALCVMAAEEGNESEARHHFDVFCQMMADKPFDWVGERRMELDRVMELLHTPAALKSHLEEIEKVKLSTAKLALPP